MTDQFLTNYTEVRFIDAIKHDLSQCTSFSFSVSFIKKAGLVLLASAIEAALERGVEGRIITSTYQNFTDIDSLYRFKTWMEQYPSFTCHLDHDSFIGNDSSTLGYHSKGYLFTFSDHTETIIGSSNITRYALLKNIEWDVIVAESDNGPVYQDALREFNDKFSHTSSLTKDLIHQYTLQLNFAIERWDMDYDISMAKIKPNFMQRKALKELNRYRAMGIGKALVIAAAGSGKTYLAAFDALNFNPSKLLYIVHEESILHKAMETFQQVFGTSVTYGIYSGTSKDIDADFLFATNLTMANTLEHFDKNEFDYIVIDECHHATAATYQKIMAYFTPAFLLGLTATPERMDNQDVFALFDQNIPFELRLRDAILNNLVVPFHYYGIRDTLIDYGLSANDERKMLAQISDEDNCAFISAQIEEHRPSGKLKALAFCRNTTHARLMAEAMSSMYHTAYLTGHNDIGERIRAYHDLQSDSTPLEILFTVDILNEGVDIPGVNMVLFLRPTESSTVFIQQLGRGLRLAPDKPYVTVLDFIGNSYKRSVQIAFALSSLANNFVVEKKLLASLVRDNFTALGLESSGVEIHIDDLSKEEIIDNIEKENFNQLSYLKQDYTNFKKYIHADHYPAHMDYLNNDCAPDLIRFMNIKINGRKNCSYYNFLKGIGETDLPLFSDEQIAFINTVSNYLPLVRPHEYMIIQCILNGIHTIDTIQSIIIDQYPALSSNAFAHACTYMKDLIHIEDNTISLSIGVDDQFEEYVRDLVAYGLTRYTSEYGDCTGFLLYQSYRKDQVMLKLDQNPSNIMLGTYYFDDSVYIFAALKKDASVEEHLNYKDKFLQPDVFQWESKGNLSSADRDKLYHRTHAYLFIRKVETENGLVLPFTYVGEGTMENLRETHNATGTLLFDIILEHELPADLQYDFGLPAQTGQVS